MSGNAAAETKNNQFLKYLAVQVGRRNVSSAVMCQGRVGHTHNRQDASFGQVASALCRAKELECPEDFKERVEACLPDYQVEILNASWDFKAWLAPLTIKVTGLNQTQKATEKRLEACHCFKLVRRETLPPELSQLVATPGFLQTVAPHGQDVILCKLYVASPTLSQPPLLFLPWQELAKVPERPPSHAIPRVPFSSRQEKEFLKTADLMMKWGYRKAHLYLTELVTWRFFLFALPTLKNLRVLRVCLSQTARLLLGAPSWPRVGRGSKGGHQVLSTRPRFFVNGPLLMP